MVSRARWATRRQRWGLYLALRAGDPPAAGLVGAAVDGGVDVAEGEGREGGAELEGLTCEVCGWPKRAGHRLCWNCWCDLLPSLRHAVRAGEFTEAVEWLVRRRAQRVSLGQCVECGMVVGHLERCPAAGGGK